MGKKKTKPIGFWKKWSNIEKELKSVIKKLGHFPTQNELTKLKLSSLSVAFHNYYGGLNAVKKKMGYESDRKDMGYWKDKNNTIYEAKKFMKERNLKTLPCFSHLHKLGAGTLGSAISKYHGGFRVFRNILGEKISNIEPGGWKNLDFVVNETERVIEENSLDRLPSLVGLAELGYSSLGSSIIKYHGGFHKFRKLIGEKSILRESGIWKNFEYTKKEARKVLKKYKLKSLPGVKKLNEMGYGALASGICHNHGGMRAFREKMGQEQIATLKGTWTDEHILEKAILAIKELGVETLPCSHSLREKGYGNLSAAIDKKGGFRKLRKRLGETSTKREDGLVKDWEYVSGEIKRFMDEHGFEKVPSYDTMRRNGASWLASAIATYHGGAYKVREKLNQNQIQKPLDYWKEYDNAFFEAQKAMKKNNSKTLPTQKKLADTGFAGLSSAIIKYHGGFREFRLKLGQKPIRRKMGSLQQLNYVLEESSRILIEYDLDELPISHEFVNLDNSLTCAIQKYHGGFPVFREKLREYMGLPSKENELESLLEEYVGV